MLLSAPDDFVLLGLPRVASQLLLYHLFLLLSPLFGVPCTLVLVGMGEGKSWDSRRGLDFFSSALPSKDLWTPSLRALEYFGLFPHSWLPIPHPSLIFPFTLHLSSC